MRQVSILNLAPPTYQALFSALCILHVFNPYNITMGPYHHFKAEETKADN